MKILAIILFSVGMGLLFGGTLSLVSETRTCRARVPVIMIAVGVGIMAICILGLALLS